MIDLVWILARNRAKRPTLCHAMNPDDREYTMCGVWLFGWSTFAMKKPITVITCRTCAKIGGIEL